MLSRSFAIALVLSAAQCHHDHEGTEAVYEGCATDEHWQTLQDYESTDRVKTDASAGPKWLDPAPNPTGETFPSATPVTLRWQPSASDPGSDKGNVSCAQLQTSSRRTTVLGLRPLHEAAISGVIFDLQFSVDHQVAYRVLTTRQRVTVPQELWSSWAQKHVTVDLVSAKLLNNDIVEGPFRAPMQSFHVTP